MLLLFEALNLLLFFFKITKATISDKFTNINIVIIMVTFLNNRGHLQHFDVTFYYNYVTCLTLSKMV